MQNNFHLFKLVPFGKDPLRSSHWTDPETALSYSDALTWLEKGGNLALCLRDHVAFDFDQRPYSITDNVDFYRQFNTIVQFTPRGYHIIYKNKSNDPLRAFKSMYPNAQFDKENGDRLKTGNAYIVLAPSRVKNPEKYDTDQPKYYFLLDDQRVKTGQLRITELH